MNDEKKTTEAEQMEPGALADSIEGLKSVLDEVDAEVRQARFLFPNQEKETLKWATLRRACGRINDITRIGVQRLVDPAAGTGAFFTPKEALDAVMANPPLDPPAPETGGGCNERRAGFSHEQTRGGVHPLSHGDIAQAYRRWRDGIADGRAVAHETAFRQAA
jgi:hypothetical protein